VWIVDNASSDDSRELIPRSCPAISYIYNDINRGFAGGNNVALRKIISSESAAVLLLNNDARIAEDHALRLLTAMQDNPRLGVVGPLLEERRGNRRIILAGGRDISRFLHTRRIFPITGNAGSAVAEASTVAEAAREDKMADSPSRSAMAEHGKPANRDALEPVDYVPGTAALIRTDLLRTIGALDEAYFFSGEMADFCRRARLAGWTCAICPQSVVTHEPSAGATRATLYQYYTLRNRFLFIRRHVNGSARTYLWSAGASARRLVGLARRPCRPIWKPE
jgi:GT2 family glycosyltransferase